jgi:serine/threonine-protein kinase LegK1
MFIKITINGKDVSQEDCRYNEELGRFFEFYKDYTNKIWHKGNPYSIDNNKPVNHNETVTFNFRWTMFQRERKIKVNGLKPEGVRYEIISNEKPIGCGRHSKIKKIEGTIRFDGSGIHLKKHGQDGRHRVVKIQTHHDGYGGNSQSEYKYSTKAGHLAIKKPLVVVHIAPNGLLTSTSYLVLDELPGYDLYDIIKKNNLSMTQRFNLSQCLLMTVKTQVTDKEMIHRDIKPENIHVDLTQTPFEVNIFDYGYATDITYPDGKNPGSLGYAPPELVGNRENFFNINEKVDVYSIARVIAQLWNVNNHSYTINYIEQHVVISSDETLADIFKGFSHSELNECQQSIIRNTLKSMLSFNPEQRLSINDALYHFSQAANASQVNLPFFSPPKKSQLQVSKNNALSP